VSLVGAKLGERRRLVDLLWELGGWMVGLGFDLPFRSCGFLCDAVYELQTLRFRDISYQPPNTHTQYSQPVGDVLGVERVSTAVVRRPVFGWEELEVFSPFEVRSDTSMSHPATNRLFILGHSVYSCFFDLAV
jgi:hypothetical protein